LGFGCVPEVNSMKMIQRLRLDSFLSFAPGSEAFDLHALNVLIGPNGSGKSNLIEAFELLRSTPTDFAAAVRVGGGPAEWIWKGERNKGQSSIATLEVDLLGLGLFQVPLRYRLEFTSVQSRVEVLDEAIEKVDALQAGPLFFYRFQRGRPVLNIRDAPSSATTVERQLRREDLLPDQSVLAQRKDPDLLPELTRVGRQFNAIGIFREWTFGRYAALRQPQLADLPEDQLLPDARNLALVLNQIEHRGDWQRFNELLKRFFPRFERMSTRISAGTVQFYLHEPGFASPIPSTRLSDGTLRFVALLATLLAPSPPPLVCIEEPELGLHPDAIALFAHLLIAAAERTQLIVTTHSDALVSELTGHPDAVIACERPGAGTKLRRLDPKKLATWLDEYRLGDLWRMGELGANP
jgi:predicted ATPase